MHQMQTHGMRPGLGILCAGGALPTASPQLLLDVYVNVSYRKPANNSNHAGAQQARLAS